ncbi:hypothetical protein [Gimesia sp.]|uniref:hypothetical protein n=1 Tax=Gimesia sp. TaxID=2024833 RepID=UPI003A94BE40
MVRKSTLSDQYGTVRIEHCDYWDLDCPILRKAHKVADSASICRWRPADEICDQLPNDFELKFLCLKGKDSIRRFIPMTGSDKLLDNLFKGGLAVLNQHQKLSDEQRWSYRLMFLFFQRVKKLSNHCERNFASSRDLRIIMTRLETAGRYNVIPEHLEIFSNGVGKSSVVKGLLTEGSKLATDHGIENPNQEQAVNYGFFAAAKISPLEITKSEEIESLVRIALYNEQNTVRCDPECQQWIEERILAALKKHLHDSQEEFDNWFAGPKNSFLTQISKQKCPYGKLNNGMVRWALMELGWKSYHYVGNCIHTQMRCFQNALPASLSESERNIFEMVYLKQDYLGDFPLLLLKERLPLLTAPMLSVLSGDDDFDFIGTIHQLLYIYSDMADVRRDADRRSQKVSKALKRSEGSNGAIGMVAYNGTRVPGMVDSRDSEPWND